MKINVTSLPAEGLKLHFSKDANWFRDIWPNKKIMDFALHIVNVSCSLKKVSETIFCVGNMKTTVDLECCRCLEVTTQVIDNEFKYTFAPAQSSFREELELSLEDLEISYYQNDIIDFDQIIFEQIALQIPIKPLCTDSCKGLCPYCGTNLNVASCNCHNDSVDERLSVLKNLKLKN